ncbi:MAG: hypothetical protein WC247_12795 [Porticoccaceae bacterium]
MILVALLTLWPAAYAHYRLPLQITSRRELWLAHLMLIAVGLGFGWAMSAVYLSPVDAPPVLTFIAGFGAVHIPAAIILWLKKQRR